MMLQDQTTKKLCQPLFCHIIFNIYASLFESSFSEQQKFPALVLKEFPGHGEKPTALRIQTPCANNSA